MSVPRSTQQQNKSRSLFKRFRLNLLSFGYIQLVTLVVQLGLVPFFLAYWGTLRYSDWLVLTGIPTMLTLLDFGVAQASSSKATMSAGALDTKSILRVMQTALLFTCAISIVVILISTVSGFLVDWTKVLHLTSIDRRDSWLIMILMTISLSTNLFSNLVAGWYRTIDYTALGTFLHANRRAADVVVSIVVLSVGGNALELACSLVVVQFILLALFALLANRLSTLRLFGFRQASIEEFKDIWKPSVAYAGFPLAQVATLQGSLQLLNQVASPSIVVAFVMSRTMMRLVIQMGVVVNSALKPEISRLAGQGESQKASRFTRRAAVWTLSGAVIVYLLGVVFGPAVVDLWSHAKVSVGRLDLMLIGIHAVLNVAWFIPAAYLIGTNRHVGIATAYGISSVFALAAWAVTSRFLPPVLGASMVLAFPELIVLGYFIYIRKHGSRSP